MKYLGKIENPKDLINKEYGDKNYVFKKDVMPTAGEDWENIIVQYTGITTTIAPIYINGYFYKCVKDISTTPATYSWQNIPIQEKGFGRGNFGTAAQIVYCTLAEYTALASRDPDTIYMITDDNQKESIAWGNITGSITSQSDLQSEINRLDYFASVAGTAGQVLARTATGVEWKSDPVTSITENTSTGVITIETI